MKLIYIFSGLLFFLTACESCDPPPSYCERVFQFDIPFSLSPEKDTFLIGDTIWVESEYEKMLLDKNSGDYIDIGKFDFRVKTGVIRIDTLGYDSNPDNFEVLDIIGKFEVQPLGQNLSIIHIVYEDDNTGRSVKAGIILNATGIFHVSFTNIRPDIEDDIHLIESSCNQKISLSYNLNEGRENNYYLEEYDENEVPSEEDFRAFGGYNFVVIE
ncbi:MAG TPA: hypothetical protein ENJ95_11790 [Bacteroidetes bacterium]|nr:hypothetical protein [Bacteroidota bacterium]